LLTEGDLSWAKSTALEEALLGYSRVTHLSFSVEKRVRSELLLSETLRPGSLKIEKDRFRFELFGEPKTLIVYDGKTLWIVEGNSVTQTRANQKSHPEIALFNRIFFSNALKEDFVISQNSNDLDIKSGSKTASFKAFFSLQPKKNYLPLKDIQIALENGQIKELFYKDDLDSLTQIIFLKEQRTNKREKNAFQFKPTPWMKVNKL
jgi:outer membrane lipoprotein-sorting protein